MEKDGRAIPDQSRTDDGSSNLSVLDLVGKFRLEDERSRDRIDRTARKRRHVEAFLRAPDDLIPRRGACEHVRVSHPHLRTMCVRLAPNAAPRALNKQYTPQARAASIAQ